MTGRRAFLLATLAAAGALSPTVASAHSLLVRSEPPRSATVTRAPERVRLWFSERIEPAYASLSVWNEAGRQVDAGAASVADDAALLTVGTPNLAPGRHTVRFRVLSVDGHVVESSLAFTIKAATR